jgi:predicted ATPase
LITRIEIDGFKSFRQFALDLEPFQVIVGLNAAGKSNLLDAFRFLSKVVTSDATRAYQEMWESTGELFTVLPDGQLTDLISFAVEFLVKEAMPDTFPHDGYARFRFELSIRRNDDAHGRKLVIEHDHVDRLAEERGTSSPSKPSNELQGVFRRVSGSDTPARTEVRATGPIGNFSFPIDNLESVTALGMLRFLVPEVQMMFQTLEQVTFLDTEPEAMRTPVSSRGPARLDPRGKYLPNVLARMQKQDDFLLEDVGADLSNLVSGLIKVEVVEDQAQGHNVVWVLTSEGKRFSLRELSDGTLRLLALAALRNDPDQQGTLLLEEPENGVHPSRVKQLVKLLRSMASDFTHPPAPGERLRQVIATTHSPTVVSQLEDHEIIFAHTADVTLEGHDKPLRVTRMSSLKTPGSSAEQAFTRREILRYLDEKDLESLSKRLRGDKKA